MRQTAALGRQWQVRDPFPTPPADEARAVRPTLAVCIATIGRRLDDLRLERLRACPGVSYHVFVQRAEEVSEVARARLAQRPDVSVVPVEGCGVARSRNAALAGVESDILLFADDDVELLCENYARLRAIFAEDPGLSCVCGVTLDEAGQPRKRFSRHMAPLRLWNAAKVGTPEIAVRRAHVARLGLGFDERFGAGTELPIGDEYIFLADLLRHNLTGRHIALPLAVHARASSGMGFDARSLETRRHVFRRAVGRLWFPYLLAFALKNWARFPSARTGLSFLRIGC
jgi:hypothetical protein